LEKPPEHWYQLIVSGYRKVRITTSVLASPDAGFEFGLLFSLTLALNLNGGNFEGKIR
jgi:hypothetical protein